MNSNTLQGIGMSFDEVNRVMAGIEQRVSNGGVSEAEIARFVTEERETAVALSLSSNSEVTSETVEATTVAHESGDSGFGLMSAERENGCFRGMYLQLNNTATTNTTKLKSAVACNLVRKYDPHLLGLLELGRNWSRYRSDQQLETFLEDLRRECRGS